MQRFPFAAIGALFLAASAAAHGQGYAIDFDSGTAGWTLDAPVNGVAWAADATPASFPFGPARSGLSLNYNNGTDYAAGTARGARSPAIDLSSMSDPVLEFWCNYHTETRGTKVDRRSLEVRDAAGATVVVAWRVASVGYSFTRGAGIAGIGPGPCSEAYDDLETGAPVSTWHRHRIFLDPAWGTVTLRFVFDPVDDRRNGYSGWAIDDLVVRNHTVPAPAGWPDLVPDDDTAGIQGTWELDRCQTRPNDRLAWSWGSSVLGDPGIHLIAGDHELSVLDETFLFFDPVHGHRHLSQYVDFSLWEQKPYGLQKLRRGPKRSFCLADVVPVDPANPPAQFPFPPNCNGVFEGISWGWQDIYPIDTPGQDMDVSGLAPGTPFYLIGVMDPINRFRETDEMNQVDAIRFELPAGAPPQTVANIVRANPYPQTAVPLSIATATLGAFQGRRIVHVTGAGFDTTLVPVVYDAGTAVEEAPFYTIVGPDEIWVVVPPGIAVPATIDLLRADGEADSLRIVLADWDDGDGDFPCGALGAEAFLLAGLAALVRRRKDRRP